jgi:hypothetical protein
MRNPTLDLDETLAVHRLEGREHGSVIVGSDWAIEDDPLIGGTKSLEDSAPQPTPGRGKGDGFALGWLRPAWAGCRLPVSGEATPRPRRTLAAARPSRPAKSRPDIHDRVRPIGRAVWGDDGVGERLELTFRHPGDATQHAAHIRIDRSNRKPERDGADGARGIWADSGEPG